DAATSTRAPGSDEVEPRPRAYRAIARYAGGPPMKLWAISDIHLGFAANRAAVQALSPRPDDWLIVAGDVGETAAHMQLAFAVLGAKFRRLIWVPGNHELYRSRGDPDAPAAPTSTRGWSSCAAP